MSDAAPHHVMIIDDEKMICSVLEDFLTEHGYKVTTAFNLADGRAALKGESLPHALILDIMLPDGNGVDFLMELRSAPRTKTLPIIMITAHRISTKDKIVGIDGGADDYMVKPFDLHEFRSRVDRLIRRVEETRASDS
jgi:two-component system phosphate regulon response regulator OmpR